MKGVFWFILWLLAVPTAEAQSQDLRDDIGQGSSVDRERLQRFPLPHNIWGIIESLEPSSVASRFDEGGLQTGTMPLIGVLAGSSVQNSFRFDGINITNPYDPGRPLLYPDWGSIQEFRTSVAAHPASIRAPGTFSVIPRRGGDTGHGEAELSYLGEPFQNASPSAERFKRFGEGRFVLDGPAPRFQRWAWLASLGIARVSRVVPGFAAIPTTNIYSGLLRTDGQVRARNEFGLLITAQVVNISHLGARRGVTPSATLYGNDRYEVIQSHWNRRQSASTVGHIRFGFSHASPTDTFQDGVLEPARIRLFTGEISGAAPLESDFALTRFSLAAGLELSRGGGSVQHILETGFEVDRSLATEENRIVGDLQLLFFPEDTPALVAQYDTPSRTKQRLSESSFFLQDRVRLGNAIHLSVGINLDASSARLPAQSSGPRTFWPSLEIPSREVVSWATLSPRVGAAFPFRLLRFRLRIFASFARYYDLLPAAYANFANPNSVGGRLLQWRDLNGDMSFQPGEAGTVLRTFGGPYSSVDPKLLRPYTNEWVVGMDGRLGHFGDAAVWAVRRDTGNRIETVNTGVPFSAFTPVPVADPGGDGVIGTADDRTLTAYDQDAQTLGTDRFTLTNPPALSARCDALQALLNLHAGRVSWSASFTAMRGVAATSPGNNEHENDAGVIGSLYDDPNTLVNARGRVFFDRAYIGKMAGEVRAPLGIRLGSVVRYLDGLPFGRRLIVTGLNQGPFFIMATPRGQPGGHRTQFNLGFDQRIGREFELGKCRLFVAADIFNLLNMSRNLREADLTGPDFQERRPIETQNPRVMRFSVRLSW